jgi:hypothetical protein
MMGVFFLPLLFLPGRMYSAYCYLPFAGLAIALTGLAGSVSAAALVLFLALWLPMDVHELRVRQRETLARDAGIRAWMDGVERFRAGGERVDAFVFSGAPAGFERWGVEGALKYFYERNDLKIHSSAESADGLHGRVAFLNWDEGRRRLDIAVRSAP